MFTCVYYSFAIFDWLCLVSCAAFESIYYIFRLMTPNTLKLVDSEEFLKSTNDTDRHYRFIQLTNGLKVLLVSDNATKTAAASLSVATGGSR